MELLISNWMRMKKVVAWILKYMKILSSRVRQNSVKILPKIGLDVSLIEEAQQEVIRLHQQQAFKEEVEALVHSSNGDRKILMKRSSVYKLDPFIDEGGLLRVGGRLRKSNLRFTDFHSILLSKDSCITRLIVEWCHQKTAHGGRGLTINEIRSNGFWVVRCNTIGREMCQMSIVARETWGARWQIYQLTEQLMNHLLQIVVWTCLVLF